MDLSERDIERLVSKLIGKVCTKCGELRPLSQYRKHPKSPDGLQYWCNPCQDNLQRRVRSTPENKQKRKYEAIKRWYKLSKEEYHNLLLESRNSCLICGSTENLGIDHDHTTGRVRGILCHGCNVALGYLKEDAERAKSLAVYIENYCNEEERKDDGNKISRHGTFTGPA